MNLHYFYFVPKDSNIKIAFASKFCVRPTSTKNYRYLNNQLDRDNVQGMGFTTDVANLDVKSAMSIPQGEAFIKNIKQS